MSLPGRIDLGWAGAVEAGRRTTIIADLEAIHNRLNLAPQMDRSFPCFQSEINGLLDDAS